MSTDLLPKAKALRKQMTDAEHCLWRQLRDRRFCEVKFRRQEPIGPYIVDFVALSEKLVIELDGGQHADEAAIVYDNKRTAYLEAQGYRVLRFWNDDCLVRTAQVLDQIGHALRQW
ncbi:endonuclease [Betaproteobacteria bacterium]|nr:endonuclease [Betaproteobacteria bacterium]